MGYQKPSGSVSVFVSVLILVLSLDCMPCNAQLSTTFYDDTCPNALAAINTVITDAVTTENRMAASIIRLHFHDCFVQGCDASILLDDTPSEKTTGANSGVRGYEVIDAAKAAVENICPGVVSCADVLAVAARDASVAVQGPSWSVRLGRRDSTTAFPDQTGTDLPRGDQELPTLITSFARKGLSEREMVALSGSHTIGQARCLTFRGRIYNNASNIDPIFAANLRANCPTTGGDGNLEPLDLVTPNRFDNNYFTNLEQRRGLLISDQTLFNGGSADSIVQGYIDNPASFASDFAAAMVAMGDIDPLTGSDGVIRTLCTTAT
ncbi:basic peroxidase-like [Cynara cardunculus var. scolymus]|uniref:basic peroxidase-like n=1 Tax=Cynara cardunculus var. scolymus TaxID=59895 RepID=UPI000D6248E2|nr:basic peroxidase-like [Cynara cardunculus var. scolymus]